MGSSTNWQESLSIVLLRPPRSCEDTSEEDALCKGEVWGDRTESREAGKNPGPCGATRTSRSQKPGEVPTSALGHPSH